jgi:hypothetical protein
MTLSIDGNSTTARLVVSATFVHYYMACSLPVAACGPQLKASVAGDIVDHIGEYIQAVSPWAPDLQRQ